MPRLSDKDYPATRRYLLDTHGWMYELNLDDVLAVARFFVPTKSFTDAEALTHRRTVTAADPSLPNRVGKIVKKPRTFPSSVDREIARAVVVPEPGPTLVGPKAREKVLRVIPVRRAAPDLHKLARVVEMMARPLEREGDWDGFALQRDHDTAA